MRSLGFDVGECLDGDFPPGREPPERVRLREEDLRRGGDGLTAEGRNGSTHYKALEQGLPWLSAWDPGNGPLLFMFDTNLPHPPFYYEPEWRDRFRPEDMILPRSYSAETFEGKPPFLREHAERGPHRLASEAQLREEMAQYYTMIAAVDQACGRIIELFRKKGMWENTVALFLADHGDLMGAHRLRRKGTLPYEELYNIPCILKPPAGVPRRRAVVEEVVASTDLPEVLLELAGLSAPPPFAGGDAIRALRRDAPSGDECVFFEHYAAWWVRHPFYGARTATMKYVRYYGDDRFEELYDLARDPDELRNVAGDPAYRERLKELSARADAWWKETGGRSADFYETEAFRNNLNRE